MGGFFCIIWFNIINKTTQTQNIKPYDWEDVFASIANYLIKNGYPTSEYDDGKVYKSIYAYNHADNYVKAVLGLSAEIKKGVDKK